MQITKTPERERYPKWSPDGKMIAYTIKDTIWVTPASEEDAIQMPIFCRKCGYVYTWSPDSREIIYASDEGLILAVSITDSETRQILNLNELGHEEAFDLCYSPDGQSLAFITYNTTRNKYGPIFVVSSDGMKTANLAADDLGGIYSLFWSPDGKWLSYNSDGFFKTGPEGAIWEADVEEFLKKASPENGN